MQVLLREGESFESLLKRFRTGVSRHGIISEFKRHQSYLSKGEKLRAKLQRAERKRQAKLAKQARRAARRAA
jgi:ribosomal protein S21